MLYQIRQNDSISSGNTLAHKQAKLITMHRQLGLRNKGRAIKGLVVSAGWNLEHLDLLKGLALGCYQPSLEVL